MKLADLRRITIKTNVRIRFSLTNGMECIMNEHGLAEIPALHAVPDFDLEQEFSQARQFILEPLPVSEKVRVKTQALTRDELAALVGSKNAEPAHDDHDE